VRYLERSWESCIFSCESQVRRQGRSARRIYLRALRHSPPSSSPLPLSFSLSLCVDTYTTLYTEHVKARRERYHATARIVFLIGGSRETYLIKHLFPLNRGTQRRQSHHGRAAYRTFSNTQHRLYRCAKLHLAGSRRVAPELSETCSPPAPLIEVTSTPRDMVPGKAADSAPCYVPARMASLVSALCVISSSESLALPYLCVCRRAPLYDARRVSRRDSLQIVQQYGRSSASTFTRPPRRLRFRSRFRACNEPSTLRGASRSGRAN